MNCSKCGSSDVNKAGIRYGGGRRSQRYICKSCYRYFFTDIDPKPPQNEPPLKTKKEINEAFTKFNSHVKGATRLAKKNIDYSPQKK